MKLTEKLNNALNENVKELKQRIRQLKSYEDGVKLQKEIDKMVDAEKLTRKEAMMLNNSIDIKTAKDY
jgi:hypothetical protein